MTTATEDLIKKLRRSSRSSDILVPKIEAFSTRPIEIDDQKDRDFLATLMAARSRPRKQRVYSPSMLASCVRQVYLHKTGEVEKRPLDRIEATSFFLNGNFMHFKWQFAMWKMHRAGIIQLIKVPYSASPALGCEVFVSNENGDYGGTIDVLAYLPWIEEVVAIDFKSMNGNAFFRAIDKGPAINYVVQLTGYGSLANASSIIELPSRIERVIIIGENKNGPVMNRRSPSPMGIHEWVYFIDDYNHEVASRLKKLRAFERRQEQPEVECYSTNIMKFKGCPFAHHCRVEVEAIKRSQKKRTAKMKEARKPIITIEGRTNGSQGKAKVKTDKKGNRERQGRRTKR